jgi:hypothetical protein
MEIILQHVSYAGKYFANMYAANILMEKTKTILMENI